MILNLYARHVNAGLSGVFLFHFCTPDMITPDCPAYFSIIFGRRTVRCVSRVVTCLSFSTAINKKSLWLACLSSFKNFFSW